MLFSRGPGATVGGHISRPASCKMLSAAGARCAWAAVGMKGLPLYLASTRLHVAAAAARKAAAPAAPAAAPAAAAQAAASSTTTRGSAPRQDLLQTLSEEQLAAATSQSSRVRVIAGPGSGKTRVIAARVLHLIREREVDPRNVLVITFTNKARGELVERLEGALRPAAAKQVYISTFHGLAFDILRRNPALLQQLWSDQHKRITGRSLAFPQSLGQSVVKVLNDTEAKRLQEQIWGGKDDKSTQDTPVSDSSSATGSSSTAKSAKALSSSSSRSSRASAASSSSSDDETEDVKEVATADKKLVALFSKLKNFGSDVSKCTGAQLVTQMLEQEVPAFANLYPGLRTRLAARYNEYVLLLAQEGLVDFDDLLCHTVHLLKHHPQLLAHLQRRYRHVLVDESQDTNSSQWELVKLLAGDTNHLFMVGDPHQGIYEFRGASPKHLSDSFDEWAGPHAATLWLKDNYRSRKAIISSALHMLHDRPAKDVQAKRMDAAGQASVEVVLAPTARDEVEVVCDHLWDQQQAGRRWQDMAVLLRSNKQAEKMQEELVLHSIPCHLISGADMWTRAEVQLAVAAAQLVTTGASHLPAVLRLVDKLPVCKGLNDARVQELQDAWWPAQLADGQNEPGHSSGNSTSNSTGSSSSSHEPGAVQGITMCEALFEGCLVPGAPLPLERSRQLVQQQQGLSLSDLLPQQLRDEVEKVYKDRKMAFSEEWEVDHINNNGSKGSSSGSGSKQDSTPRHKADRAAAVAAADAMRQQLEELAPPWQPSHPTVAAFGKTKPRRAALQRLRGLLQLGAALAEVAPPAEALKVLLQVAGVLEWAAREDLAAAKKKGRPGRVRRLQHMLRLAGRDSCYKVAPPDLQEPRSRAGAQGGAPAGGPQTPGLSSLQQFVAYANLMADNTDTEAAGQEEGDGRVQLMTLHSSKGKEFPVVVIPHVVDGTIPSGMSVSKSEQQQERNLLYVGMTRAEDLLLVTAHTQQASRWPGSGTSGGPSPFLKPLLAKRAAGVRVRIID